MPAIKPKAKPKAPAAIQFFDMTVVLSSVLVTADRHDGRVTDLHVVVQAAPPCRRAAERAMRERMALSS
jgi:hypothetical protein